MMLRKVRGFVLLAGVLSIIVQSAFCEVVSLNDSTFEHQTQASTGATTGSWLIMMGTADGCTACSTLKPMFEELGQDETLYERSIVLGSLDVNDSPSTAMRFGVQTIPTIIYLHKKKLYRFPVDVGRSVESLREFVLEHYSKSLAEEIPLPPSAMDELLEVWKKLQGSGMLLYAFIGMGIMLLGTIGVLISALLAGSKAKKATKKE